MEEQKMDEVMEETLEYPTVVVKASSGEDVELAVIDEFEFEHKTYVACAMIEGDTVNEEKGVFLYRASERDGELMVQKITNKIDYEKVVQAYMEME